MNQNTMNHRSDNKKLIDELVSSGRSRGWYPVANGKSFVMARCSNQAMEGNKKVCGGITSIIFRNGHNVEVLKCFLCHSTTLVGYVI